MPPRLYENYTVRDRQQLIDIRDQQEQAALRAVVRDGLQEAGTFSVWGM